MKTSPEKALNDAQHVSPETVKLPHTRFSTTLDRLVLRAGKVAAIVWSLLILTIILNVTLRYGFSLGSIMLEEVQWHLYAVGFMMAISYSYSLDAHIRVDLISAHYNVKKAAWIEVIGIITLLLPFTVFVFYYSLDFFVQSFKAGEISSSPAGLPYRWAIKAVLPLGFFLLTMAAIARLQRCISLIRSLQRKT